VPADPDVRARVPHDRHARSPADRDHQRRLAETGAQVRVYVPYGSDWYGYLVRRLAERPANLAFFLRSLWSVS
jgi:proline dehydrogenase